MIKEQTVKNTKVSRRLFWPKLRGRTSIIIKKAIRAIGENIIKA